MLIISRMEEELDGQHFFKTEQKTEQAYKDRKKDFSLENEGLIRM